MITYSKIKSIAAERGVLDIVIEKCYLEARMPKTKNFSQYITWLIKKAYLMDHKQKKDDKRHGF